MMANQNKDILKILCAGTSINYTKITPSRTTNAKLVQNKTESSGNMMLNLRKHHKIRVKGFDVADPIDTLSGMKEKFPIILRSILQHLKESRITAPTPIQMQCIPLLLQKRSVLACAPTGSGKTMCFVLPILSHLKKSEKGSFRALVLSPTRELAHQTFREFKKFGGPRKFNYHFLTKSRAKSNLLSTDSGNKDVLIATPSYLLHMLKEDKIDLSKLQFCVLDEADLLFGAQFKDEVCQILEYIDLVKVTVGLFSATLGNSIDEWCFTHLDNFVQVFIGGVNYANSNIKQSLKFVGTEESKIYTLRMIIQKGFQPPMLIFTQTKDRAKQVFGELKLVNQKVDVIHSDLNQHQRETAIDNFRGGKTWILICTDLMGRGMDFKNVNHVVNFDLPQTKTDYIHRIGRTGRAGRDGEATTFFTESDKERLPSIINVLKNAGCVLPEWLTNLKGLSHRDYKKATTKPVRRKDISTVPKYDIERSKKRKLMIADSKARKKASLSKSDG